MKHKHIQKGQSMTQYLVLMFVLTLASLSSVGQFGLKSKQQVGIIAGEVGGVVGKQSTTPPSTTSNNNQSNSSYAGAGTSTSTTQAPSETSSTNTVTTPGTNAPNTTPAVPTTTPSNPVANNPVVNPTQTSSNTNNNHPTTTETNTNNNNTGQNNLGNGTTTTGEPPKPEEVKCDTKWQDEAYQAGECTSWFCKNISKNISGRMKAAVNTVVDFVEGLLKGVGDQLNDLWELIKDPSLLLDIAKQFINDPQGTIKTIVKGVVDDVDKVLQCGPGDIGRVIGKNVNPVAVLNILGKLSKSAKLAKYIKKKKHDIECLSFPAGTPIWTPDGQVRIENILKGSLVNSRNENGFANQAQSVLALHNRIATGYQRIRTEKGIIEATPEHPFWVQGKGWVEAKDIEWEDPIATIDGDVISYDNDFIEKEIKVYNFSVDKTHSYFAGGFGAWVHNVDCGKYAPIPKTINFSDLGKKLGEGGVKEVYDWKDGLVVGVAKPKKNPKWLENEFNALRDIEKVGLPVVKAHGLTKVDGRQAIVLSKIDGIGSKDFARDIAGKIMPHPSLNKKTVADLKKIKQTMQFNKIRIDDLQFIIKKDGSVVIADPAGIHKKKAPSKKNIQTINELIIAAGGTP